ncbi:MULTISPECIES: lipoprotein insertase outer membrane protein LolB [unclassified Legionella]|uniref:lipoprotein insertase outer membrane protein LolB n=1 Tax=unclassified Legionella TaxID=2622702 RepID=UPI0010554502|nr:MULTISPECIES: lipoprotein insertase outer membrane protein LolB [unclassified Legionella]MDI9819194.1 lipoprotein insertase outer membrane protein LolB [Legionella sp. PL877]
MRDIKPIIKPVLIIPFILLAACAPRPATLGPYPEMSSNRSSSAATINKKIENNQESAQTTETAANKKQGIASSGETAKRAATASASAISTWEISGAMAARSKSKGWNASVNWLQRGVGNYQIRLFGPLGSGTVIINKKGGVVTYQDGPKSASSSNADELLKRATGIRLPVNNLYYWVRGLPAPGSVQSVKRDPANHVLVLRQAGYVIEYGQYMSVGKTVLPRLIRLQGNGIFIKFVIKRWRL